MADYRLGVIAFGDSITNGGGELQWGVALQSWALWVARGLGLPFTTYAVDGAVAADVAARQLAAWRERDARAQDRYDLGCLYIGVNDVRGLDWDAEAYSRHLDTALRALAARCDRLLVATIPNDLGRPRAPRARIEDANRRIEAGATEHGALVLDLRDFGARNHVMVDRVHPTAFGQVAMAERALDRLAADGLHVRVRPHTLIAPAEKTRWRALRGDATYAYRALKQAAAAARPAVRAAAARSGRTATPAPGTPASPSRSTPRPAIPPDRAR
jgi:lysophospholipase L1-like esterase